MALARSRETVHHAAQLLALAAVSYLEPQADDSHTSLSWLEPTGALASQPIAAESSLRFGLRLRDLTLVVIDEASGDESAALPLDGRTRDHALQWLRLESSQRGLDGDRLRSKMHFSIAPHPTDEGHPFQRAADGTLEELANWYGDASLLLETRRRSTNGAGPVRCWPHHFDIASLVRLPTDDRLQTIGIGLSPGDESCAEPYYYVSPYPTPSAIPQPLSVGSWHTVGWWGAALRGSELVKLAPGDEQAAVVSRFIDEAVARLTSGLNTAAPSSLV